MYRRAEAADAPALAAFAERVFVASFEDQLARADLAEVAAKRFTVERQHRDITSANSVVFLAVEDDIVGYAHVLVSSRPEFEVSAANPAQLKRIYVDAAWQGRGVAQRLLELVESYARSHGCDALWLGVWEKNPRGIAFYEKHGFAPIGESPVTVGRMALIHHYMSKAIT